MLHLYVRAKSGHLVSNLELIWDIAPLDLGLEYLSNKADQESKQMVQNFHSFIVSIQNTEPLFIGFYN